MNLGTLEFEFLANIARLRQDMDEAKSVVGGAMDKIKAGADVAAKALVALTGVAGAAAFVSMIKGALDAQAALHDLSIQTGASVAALGAFKSVGAYTETSVDAIAGAMTKLSKSMSMSTEDSKGAAIAIRALGINFDDFKRLKPEEQLLVAAKALNQFEDGADKTAAAMLMFGKEGARMLPFLKDLGDEADNISAKLTDQEKATRAAQAAMSDAFGDNLTKIRKDSEAWKKDIAAGIVPALYEFSQAFVDVANGAGGVKEYLGKLSKDGTLTEWARLGVTAVTYLADAFQITARVLTTIGQEIGVTIARAGVEITALVDAAKVAASGNLSGACDTLTKGLNTSKQMAADFRAEVSVALGEQTWGEKMRARMDDLRGLGANTQDAKQKLSSLADVAAQAKREQEAAAAAAKAHAEALRKQEAAAAAAAKAGSDLVATLQRKADAAAMELAAGRKLTEAEKEALDMEAKLREGKITLTDEELRRARSLIETTAATLSDIAAQEAARKAIEEHNKAVQKHIDTLDQQTKKQTDENYAMAHGRDALAQLELARLKEEAATLAQVVAREDLLGVCTEETEAHKRTLEALTDLIAAREEGAHLKAAKDAADEWKKTADAIGTSLTDSLFRAFEQGKSFGQALMDALKAMFKTTVLKLVIQPVQNGVNTFVNGLIGGSDSTGGAGGFSNWFSTGASLYQSGRNAYSALSTMLGGSGLSGVVSGGGGISGAVGAGGGFTGSGMGFTGASGSTYGSISGAGASTWGTAAGGSGSTAGAGGASMGAWAGLAAVVAILSTMAASDYRKGFNADSARETGTLLGRANAAKYDMFTRLGISSEAASILSGSTPIAKLFGKGRTEVRWQGVTGQFSGGDVQNATGFQGLHRDGGLFRSNDDWVETKALASETTDALRKQASAVYASVQAYTDALGLPADALKTVVTKFDIRDIVEGQAVKAEEVQQKTLEAFVQYQSDLFGALAPAVKEFQRAGETVEQTLNRLMAVRDFTAAINQYGGVFSRIAQLSLAAKEELIAFAGGMDALVQKSQAFVDAFYTTDEKAGLQAAQLLATFKSLGVDASAFGSREDFRALVERQELDTTEGRKTLAALLDLGPTFAGLADYLKESGKTLAGAAEAAPQVALLQNILGKQSAGADAQTTLVAAAAETNTLLTDIHSAITTGNEAVAGAVERFGDALERFDTLIGEYATRPIVEMP